MGTPLAVIVLGIIAVFTTYQEIGSWGGGFMALLVLAVAVLDLIWGKLERTFSQTVNGVYYHRRRKYLRWVFYMILVILGLHLHFTSPIGGG